MNNIQYNLGQGIGRKAAGIDHVSCLLFPNQNAPATWSDNIRSFLSISDVESFGIAEADPVFGLVWYCAREFFRLSQAGAELYIVFGGIDADNIIAKSNGNICQYAIIADISYINTAQQFCEQLKAKGAPASLLLGLTGAVNLNNLIDLRTSYTANYVSVLIAGDSGAAGGTLARNLGLDYVPAVGAVLGAVSRSKVNESIAWVQNFDFAKNSDELQTILLANGQPLQSIPATLLDTLDAKGYIFFNKYVGLAGSYLNDNHTSTARTDDYAFINDNRVMTKVQRVVNTALLPQLSSPLRVQSNGQLSAATISFFRALVSNELNALEIAGEISTYSVEINPAQNVLSTSVLSIDVTIVPVGVARNIIVNLQFSLSV